MLKNVHASRKQTSQSTFEVKRRRKTVVLLSLYSKSFHISDIRLILRLPKEQHIFYVDNFHRNNKFKEKKKVLLFAVAKTGIHMRMCPCTLVIFTWSRCEQVLFVHVFTTIPPRLTDPCSFITVLLVTREPEQTTLLFWSATCSVTPHGLHTADRR